MPSFIQSGLKTILSEDGLQVRIYYLECMAQATYIVSHERAAFIVDPRRDVDAYIKVHAYKHIAHVGTGLYEQGGCCSGIIFCL